LSGTVISPTKFEKSDREVAMLVVSRRIGESVVIGGSVSVLLVEMDRGKVRLGIHAPRDVPVDRAEVREEKLKSGTASDSDNVVMLGKVVEEVAKNCFLSEMNYQEAGDFCESVADNLSEYRSAHGWVESVVSKVWKEFCNQKEVTT
jgi:carbon storage regulator